MTYLFDTDALSESLRKRPAQDYLRWLRTVTRENQYTSAVVVAELYKGAYRSHKSNQLLTKIHHIILPQVTILPFDVKTAEIYGRISAELEKKGQPLAHPDLQIAATALYHGLELVTGNLKHFSRVPGLKINPVLSRAKTNMYKDDKT